MFTTQTVQFFVHKERLSFLQEALSSKLTIIESNLTPEEQGDNVFVEILLEMDTDVMKIWHAGIDCGMKFMTDSYQKIKIA